MSSVPGLRWLRLHPFAAALGAAGLVALSTAAIGWARLASAERRHRELKAAAEMQTRPREDRGAQELESIARELMRRLPPRRDLESWRGTLTELAAKFSLKIPDIRMEDSPASPAAAPACSAALLELRLEGPASGFIEFLQGLAGMERLVEIRRLALLPGAGGSSQAELSLAVFSLNDNS